MVVVAWCVRPVADMHAMLLHAPPSSRCWLAQYWLSVGAEGQEGRAGRRRFVMVVSLVEVLGVVIMRGCYCAWNRGDDTDT